MSRLSSLSTSFPSPTSSPILIDTAFLFLLQGGYYLLSRRFLLHALPTLRQISRRDSEGADGSGETNDTGILGLPGLARDDNDDEDGVINASGGLSDTGSTHGLPGSSSRRNNLNLYPPTGQNASRAHLATTDDLDESDTDSLISYAAGSPSPGISNRPSMDGYPLLPLHSQAQPNLSGQHSSHLRPGSIVTDPNVLNKKLAKEVSIRSPGTSSSTVRGVEPRKKVLKLFHGRSRSNRAPVDGERVRTTRGLGFLARCVQVQSRSLTELEQRSIYMQLIG